MSGEVMLLLRLALAGVLYAFLGWAIWVLWRGLRRNAILPKRKSEISDGSIDPITLSMPGVDEIYSFSVPKVVVGRDPACELQVQDSTVSARHARLSYYDGYWWVRDLGSKNGTALNGAPASDDLVLSDGDELRFGALVTVVHLESEGV